MNVNQRKFFKELSELMEKHSTRMNFSRCYGEVEGVVFNIGGKKTEIITFDLTPTIIKKTLIKGE